jgi:hypothetical protein
MEIRQGNYRAEANAESGDTSEPKTCAKDHSRLPSILGEESYRQVRHQK